jgi:hypothetical protein
MAARHEATRGRPLVPPALMLLAAVIAAVIVTFFNVDIGQHLDRAGRSLRNRSPEARLDLPRTRDDDRPQIYAYVTPGNLRSRASRSRDPTRTRASFFEAKRIVRSTCPGGRCSASSCTLTWTLTGWRMVVQRFPDGNAHLPRLHAEAEPECEAAVVQDPRVGGLCQ